MNIFTQLRINLLFSATKLFPQILERFQLSKILFNDACGILKLSCVEDKEELVNIGKMKVFSIFLFLTRLCEVQEASLCRHLCIVGGVGVGGVGVQC